MNATLTNRTQHLHDRQHTTKFTYNNKYRINVMTFHDKNRKQIRTTISLVEYEQRDNGIQVEKSIGSIFSDFFSRPIETISCARFSDRAFALAVESGLRIYFDEFQNEYETEIVKMLTTNTQTILRYDLTK